MATVRILETSCDAASTTDGQQSDRPLSALLSQALVAFTIEFDNEFERLMSESGYHGAHLSMLAWTNLMRFVPASGLMVREVTAQSLSDQRQTKHMLGCLERWGYVALGAGTLSGQSMDAGIRQPGARGQNNGWGSGRGIGAGWGVWLTAKGARAREIWPSLFNTIEQRWRDRFGADRFDQLRQGLLSIASGLRLALPLGLVDVRERKQTFPVRASTGTHALPLPALLSQVLLVFAIEFEPLSEAPLALCANTLRVLGEKPIPVKEIPRLTGGSPEEAGIGWRHRPYVVVEADSAGGHGKTVRLTPRGLNAQNAYNRLVDVIEKRWVHQFGSGVVHSLRECLLGLFDAGSNGRPLIAEGLIPPPGTVRAGGIAPSLGRRTVGAAARQRARDMLAQTEAFLDNPAAALPHYPLYDMNRGFGP
jgi:hypothetical protein